MKLKRIIAALTIIAVAVVALVWDAVKRWRAATEVMVKRLRDVRRRPLNPRYDGAELDSLPAPVAKYLRKALHDGHPIIVGAKVTQHGIFLMNPKSGGWQPFAAEEHFTSIPPGFVWDAQIAMFPGVNALVRDSMIDGSAAISASAAGVMKIMETHTSPELTAAAMQRYLAEAVWFPTALLPGNGVTWTAIDDSSARATITAAGTTVSLDFRFGGDGLVKSVYTPARYREEGGRLVQRPWIGTFSQYEERRRVLVPIKGEVAWDLPEGKLPYWRGSVVRVDYDYAD